MSEIRLRGKPFFTGLMAVLVSPTPIKVLCVFGTHKAMREKFFECADQVLKLGRGFEVRMADNCIKTPIGSVVTFRSISSHDAMLSLQGMELHDLWIEDGHPLGEDVYKRLQCRVRL